MSTQVGAEPPRTAIPKAPLVGRDAELAALEAALAKAITTRLPQTVTVLAGAGMGKGRLLAEFLTRVRERERKVRIFRGPAQAGGPSHGAVQRILRSRFGIADTADPEAARALLRSTVSELLGDQRVTEFLHFLGAYLDIRFPESPFTKALEGDELQLARVSRAVLRRFLEADAQHGAIVLTFENLHDAHDETLDLVRYLSESLTDVPILLVVSARPELLTRRPDFASGPNHGRVDLAPLAPEHAASLVRALLVHVAEPGADLIDAAVDVAGGSPYLLEQMVRAYLSSGALVPMPDGSWAVDLDRLEDAQLPLTVDEAIAARIASMAPPERQLMERAATMGGVFWLGALVSLGRLDREVPALWGGAEDLGAHYRDLLDALEERDYVMRFDDSSIPGEEEYAFKHNLEREALHRLVSAGDARRYHRRVAEWLELRLTDRGEEALEQLAHHYEEGDAQGQAALHYLAAGDRARDRYANSKAADFYDKGLTLIGESEVVRRLDALHNFGDVLQLLGDNEGALERFREMLALAYQLDLKSKGGAAHNRLGRLYRAIGQLEEAMRHLGTGHALFDAAGDARGVASSLDDVGKVHWMRGAYDPAERFARRSLDLRRELGDRRSIALSLNNLGLVYQDSGRFDEALACFNEALAIRREIGDASGMAQTLNNLGTIHQDNGDHVEAAELWTRALEYARRVGDRMREAVILTNLGESSYRQGKAEAAIAVLGEAERISANLGDRILEAEILRGLAKAHALLRDHGAARAYIERSVKLFGEARSKPFLGVALRTLAEVEAASEDPGRARAAEAAFRQSLAIFEELGNEVELAHTCQSFADMLTRSAVDGSERAREAAGLRDRALAIHGKQLASESYTLPPLEGEETNPGVRMP